MIQEKLGRNYDVAERKLCRNRRKITGIHEYDNSKSDEDIIKCIVSQNHLNGDLNKSTTEILCRPRSK